jgi:hypothetical protein
MSSDFPFIEIPPELHEALGEPVPETRIYRKAGPQEEMTYWYSLIVERFGHAVSPGGVAMFAPVSRAAVHKRIKEGKLTCFRYDITHRKRSLFGVKKDVRELEVLMVPESECRAWGKEIEQRAIERGVVTEKELEGDKPDWAGRFLEPNSRWERQQLKRAGRKGR